MSLWSLVALHMTEYLHDPDKSTHLFVQEVSQVTDLMSLAAILAMMLTSQFGLARKFITLIKIHSHDENYH